VGILLLFGNSDRCADFVRHQSPGIHAADVFLILLFLLDRLSRRCVAPASVTCSLAIILRGAWVSGLVQCCDLSCARDLSRGFVKTTADMLALYGLVVCEVSVILKKSGTDIPIARE
jgi:hypothetical protein